MPQNRSTIPHRAPLVVGLVGAVGIDLEEVSNAVRRSLGEVGYEAEPLHLSKYLEDVGTKGQDLLGRPIRSPYGERLLDLQTAGDELRRKVGKDAMAYFAILHIVPHLQPNKAFVVRSFKTPEEVERMRTVFGRGFLLVSAYSPKPTRLHTVEQLIAAKMGRTNYQSNTEFKDIASDIIERDEKELEDFGQNVRHAFPLGDVFVDVSKPGNVDREIERFVKLLFGCPNITPTKAEQAMHLAQTARLRSSALQRQVGAALVNEEGDVLAIGCNDVPKPFGGLYWPEDNGQRDFEVKKDLAKEEKLDMVAAMLKRLGGGDNQPSILAEDSKRDLESNSGEFAKTILARLKGTRVAELIEFFRTTHAEMEAILSAARRGVPVKNSILYTTTFPCHECSRHIVTAGVRRVIFIEPYEKSLGPKLHFDSLSVEQPDDDKVNVMAFVGVGPRAYRRFFDWRRSKTDALHVECHHDNDKPVVFVDIDIDQRFLELEKQRLARLAQAENFVNRLYEARLITDEERRKFLGG